MAINKKLRLQVYNKHEGHCAYCGEAITLKEMQVDHIRPKRNFYHGLKSEIPEYNHDDLQNLNPALIPRDVNHPTPKPIKLLELILRKFTYEGETILDPFAGSGSTLRAAKELGRKATGIEIKKDYCKVIIDEISQTEMQFCKDEAV